MHDLRGILKMSKFWVTVDKYLALLNDELKHDKNYEPGMKFIPDPDHLMRRTALVYKFVPAHKQSIASKIAVRISKRYAIKG